MPTTNGVHASPSRHRHRRNSDANDNVRWYQQRITDATADTHTRSVFSRLLHWGPIGVMLSFALTKSRKYHRRHQRYGHYLLGVYLLAFVLVPAWRKRFLHRRLGRFPSVELAHTQQPARSGRCRPWLCAA